MSADYWMLYASLFTGFMLILWDTTNLRSELKDIKYQLMSEEDLKLDILKKRSWKWEK